MWVYYSLSIIKVAGEGHNKRNEHFKWNNDCTKLKSHLPVIVFSCDSILTSGFYREPTRNTEGGRQVDGLIAMLLVSQTGTQTN